MTRVVEGEGEGEEKREKEEGREGRGGKGRKTLGGERVDLIFNSFRGVASFSLEKQQSDGKQRKVFSTSAHTSDAPSLMLDKFSARKGRTSPSKTSFSPWVKQPRACLSLSLFFFPFPSLRTETYPHASNSNSLVRQGARDLTF